MSTRCVGIIVNVMSGLSVRIGVLRRSASLKREPQRSRKGPFRGHHLRPAIGMIPNNPVQRVVRVNVVVAVVAAGEVVVNGKGWTALWGRLRRPQLVPPCVRFPLSP
jgi:hypothetical protein